MRDKVFRVLEPEVPGGLGENTVLDRSTTPPTVTLLHFEFEDWLGDDLVTTYPCFLVTEALKQSLEQFRGAGYSFGELGVSKSESFLQRVPNKVLPTFHWWKIDGQAGQDDAGIDKKSGLVVSEELLAVLQQYNIANCTIRKRPYRP